MVTATCDRLGAAVTEVADLDRDACSDDDLRRLLRACEDARRRPHAGPSTGAR